MNTSPRDRLTFWATLAAPSALLLLILLLPTITLLLATPLNALGALAQHPHAAEALRLSLLTTALSTGLAVLLGTPLAWLLAQRRGRAVRWVETLIELPLVLPPLITGLALLIALGPQGPLGAALAAAGLHLPFSTAAVVIAQLATAAPLYVQGATSALRAVDPELLYVARSLGAGPWRTLLRIALPLAAPGLLTAAALTWARALGEFGATLLFAGNLPGATQTLPLLVYTTLEADLHAAQAVAALLALVGYTLLLLLRRPFQRRDPNTTHQAP